MIVITAGRACFNDGKHCRVYSAVDGPIELPAAVEQKWVSAGVAAYVDAPSVPTLIPAPKPTRKQAPAPNQEDPVAETYDEDAPEGDTSDDYAAWTFNELRDECRVRGLTIPRNVTKKQLAHILRDNDGEAPDFSGDVQ